MSVSVKDKASNAAVRLALRMGVKPTEMKRFMKFATVGVIGAIVDFGIFNILRIVLRGAVAPEYETIAVTGAQTVSFLAAIFSNFMWNRYWTYPDSRAKSFRRQFVQFGLVNVAGLIIRGPIVYFSHVAFGDLFQRLFTLNSELASTLGDNFSLAIAVGIVMFWNFFVNRYWTYNDVE